MILGFISLLLIVLQAPISDICIPKSIGATWHPCKKGDQKSSEKDSEKDGRKLLQFLDSGFSERRILAAKEIDKCTKNVSSIIIIIIISSFNFMFPNGIYIYIDIFWCSY